MNIDNTVGFFGKLPAHGDFIHRNLPTGFMTPWDNWLQSFISSTRQQLGDRWLDIYLTSPVWRFFFAPGVIDGNQWAGVMLPSVDRVGRYFPFSVISNIPPAINPMDFTAAQTTWYESMANSCLAALEGQITIDDLLQEVQDLQIDQADLYQPAGNQPLTGPGVMVDIDFDEPSPAAVFPFMLDSFIISAFASYSVWSTRGSQLINPCAFVAKGLPSLRGAAAMMDGQWQQRGWHQPYRLTPL